jgi:hypothetical protein
LADLSFVWIERDCSDLIRVVFEEKQAMAEAGAAGTVIVGAGPAGL